MINRLLLPPHPIIGSAHPKKQHYFCTSFCGVACSCPFTIPVPLCSNDIDDLWDYCTWVAPCSESRILSKHFIHRADGCKMHCVIYYAEQSTTPTTYHNRLLSVDTDVWLGNMLLVWANHSWPPELVLAPNDVLQVLV